MTANVNIEAAPAVNVTSTARLATLLLGAAVLTACAFAFVGLTSEGYWTDELFSVFLINHHGGLAEVWRRALTDTHPPLYYFLLWGWAQVFGQSEIALRSLSALLCVGAVAVFIAGTHRLFSLNARLFAAAVAVTSPFWFTQSQNARNYTLCFLFGAILLVLAIRARDAARQGRPIPALTLAGLGLFGALNAFTHFYAFLAVGLLYLFLILTTPSLRLRLTLVLCGVAIFVSELAYIRVLLHSTQQNTHDMWFRSDVHFFVQQTYVAAQEMIGPGALAALAALAATLIWSKVRRTRPAAPATPGVWWTLALAAFLIGGVMAGGIAISLILAPSYSNMNLLVASPFLWPALAAAFDAANARAPGRWTLVAAGVPALALTVQLVSQYERWLPRGEAWRESARLVLDQRGCAGQPIPVVLPAKFGPPTPFFRDLAQHDFYGYYFAGQAARLQPLRAGEVLDPARNPTLRARAAPGTCRVLAWAVHDIDKPRAMAFAAHLAAAAGLPRDKVETVMFTTSHPTWTYSKWIEVGFVFLRRDP